MALKPQVHGGDGIRDDDSFEVEVSDRGVKVNHKRGGEELGSGAHRFDMRLVATDMKPNRFLSVWSLIHTFFLNGQGRPFCRVPLPSEDGARSGSGIVQREPADTGLRKYTVQGGDVISLSTPAYGCRGQEWAVVLRRGGQEIARVGFQQDCIDKRDAGLLYDLHRTAMLTMAQHLNPRGLGVCVWNVDLDPTKRGDSNELMVQGFINAALQDHTVLESSVNMKAANAILAIDFMVLPVGTALR
ncbi:MAG TPA: hypothetical protein QF873_02685 [Patescibacteria group bacterium]|nr:hypothetical protein [Patescibacteria group bacterium]|tara:strand:- start:85 stop:816 length:732 start_codon:yes stop_codon:yes gene_type:complete